MKYTNIRKGDTFLNTNNNLVKVLHVHNSGNRVHLATSTGIDYHDSIRSMITRLENKVYTNYKSITTKESYKIY